MTRLAVCLAVLTGLAACAQQPFTSPDDKEPARKNVVINFGNADIMPADARVDQGGSVAFSNISSYAAVVVLPEDERAKFPCEMRPDWAKVAAGYQSIPIQGDSDDVVLPCLPPPGTYPYTINLYRDLETPDNPDFTLSGRIIVE